MNLGKPGPRIRIGGILRRIPLIQFQRVVARGVGESIGRQQPRRGQQGEPAGRHRAAKSRGRLASSPVRRMQQCHGGDCRQRHDGPADQPPAVGARSAAARRRSAVTAALLLDIS